MTQFAYKAIDERGQERIGAIEAADGREAAANLRMKSWYVLELSEGGLAEQTRLPAWLDYLKPSRYARVKQVDQIMLFRQLALMIKSGQTIIESIEACNRIVHKHKLRSALEAMADEIRQGSSFSGALNNHDDIFAPFMGKLVAAGEASGELDTVLERISVDMERKLETKRQLLTSLTYPVIVLLMAIAVISFLVVGVIPKFASFLEGRDAELPAITLAMLDFSTWVQTYGGSLVMFIGISVFAILVAYTQEPARLRIDRWLLHIPIIGGSISASTMAQTGWTLSMLLRSGLTALDSLRINRDVTKNAHFQACFDEAAERLLGGQSLTEALNQPNLPMMVRHLISVGERSGELEQVTEELGRFYTDEMSARIKAMTAMIEPMLTVFIGGMVGFVYLAFFSAVMAVSTGGR